MAFRCELFGVFVPAKIIFVIAVITGIHVYGSNTTSDCVLTGMVCFMGYFNKIAWSFFCFRSFCMKIMH